MAAFPFMNLPLWRGFAQRSLDCSCLSDEEKLVALKVWREQWDAFCHWIVNTYGDFLDSGL